MNQLIPKVIHYCWFGGQPLPEDAKKCIASWKKFLPDYEIKEWNEDNFDLSCCEYVKEAYREKKWAFVSDYARFQILYENGGLYFDTDVEVIRPLDDLIEKGSFMGEEAGTTNYIGTECNPGLGLAAVPRLALYEEILDYYYIQHFVNEDGKINQETVVSRVTKLLNSHGFQGDGQIEKILDVYIYPPEYFCPYNNHSGVMNITENTRSIHHYSGSWVSNLEKLITKIEQCDGDEKSFELKMRRLVSLPLRIVNKYKTEGAKGVFDTIKKRI